MRESESLSLTELLGDLGSLPAVSIRLMLSRAESEAGGRVLRAAVMKVAPDVSAADWTLYDYGPVTFIAKSLPGAEIAQWFGERKGEIARLEFGAPELQDYLRAERLQPCPIPLLRRSVATAYALRMESEDRPL